MCRTQQIWFKHITKEQATEADTNHRLCVLENRIVQWQDRTGYLILHCSEFRSKSKPLVEINPNTQNCFSTHRPVSLPTAYLLAEKSINDNYCYPVDLIHFQAEWPLILILGGQCLRVYVSFFLLLGAVCVELDHVVYLRYVFLQQGVWN